MATKKSNEEIFDIKSLITSNEMSAADRKALLEALSDKVTEEDIAERQKAQEFEQITNFKDPRVVVYTQDCIFDVFNNKTSRSFKMSGFKVCALFGTKDSEIAQLKAKTIKDGRLVKNEYRIKFLYANVGIED